MKHIITFVCTLAVVTYLWNPFLTLATPDMVPEDYEMEVLSEGDEIVEENIQQAAEMPDLGITAKSAILMEASTGTVIYEKDGDKQLSPASITKIMTLLLIFDALEEGRIRLSDEAVTSAYAKSMGGSQVFLEEGEIQTVETLIKCIVVASGNDASVVMAEYIAGSEGEFVRMMNERAASIGMTGTNFEDCCGLTESANHYTTAKDVAIMSRELITKYPQIRDYSTIWMENILHVTNKGTSEFGLANTNKLLKQYQWTTGLKTGSTSVAKYCVAATAEKDGIELIAVIMAAPDYKVRFSEAATLMDYGYARCVLYRDENPEILEPVPIGNGLEETLDCEYLGQFTYLGIGEVNFDAIEKEWMFDEGLEAPIEQGARVGSLVYRLDGSEIGRLEIVAAESMAKARFVDYLQRAVRRFQL